MIIGTSNFTSFSSACAYYRNQGLSIRDVKEKINEGEIVIGRPSRAPHERIVTIDNGTRYAIEGEGN